MQLLQTSAVSSVSTCMPSIKLTGGAHRSQISKQILPEASRLKLVMLCSGNHERDWPNTGDRFYPLQSRSDSGE